MLGQIFELSPTLWSSDYFSSCERDFWKCCEKFGVGRIRRLFFSLYVNELLFSTYIPYAILYWHEKSEAYQYRTSPDNNF